MASREEAALQRELLQVLRDKMRPWVQHGQASLILAQAPLRDQTGVVIHPQKIPLLPATGRRRREQSLARWPKYGLASIRNPYFGCVLEGEADFAIGVTEQMAEGNTAICRQHGRYVLQLSSRTIFIMPPGVPYSDGQLAHWERPNPEQARSQIFWMSVLPEGALIHTCRTQGHKHTISHVWFLRDTLLLQLAENIIEVLQSGAVLAHEISRALLLALLLRVENGFMSGHARTMEKAGNFEGSGAPVSKDDMSLNAQIVERACRYIQTHLHVALSVESIAAHAYVSQPHLNRLFQAELGTSVMKFVTARRVEAAKSLLKDTNLPIQEIAHCVGYPHPSHLSQVFQRLTGLSPVNYRSGQKPRKSLTALDGRSSAASGMRGRNTGLKS